MKDNILIQFFEYYDQIQINHQILSLNNAF